MTNYQIFVHRYRRCDAKDKCVYVIEKRNVCINQASVKQRFTVLTSEISLIWFEVSNIFSYVLEHTTIEFVSRFQLFYGKKFFEKGDMVEPLYENFLTNIEPELCVFYFIFVCVSLRI